MENIKLGIIGTNFVSDWLCESVDLSDGITNRAVYSRTYEKGQEFATKHNIQNIYTDIDDFLSSDIDAVYVASPNFLHYEHSIKALEAGKHVLLEKPVAHNEKEFDILTQKAEEKGLILLEAMRPAHDPAIDEVRKALNEIGTVRRFVFDFCQYSSRYDKFKSGEILNAFNPELGNAAVMDIGVYAINCMVNLFGEPNSLYSKSIILNNGMEGMGNVFLDYGNVQGQVVYSKITDSCTPSVIIGEDGYISIEKISLFECIKLKKRGESEKILISGRNENNMIYEIKDFVDCINGKMSTLRHNQITKITLKIIDEIRRQNKIVFPHEII